MSFCVIDDESWRSPAIALHGLTNSDIGLYWRMVSWSAEHRLDGHVPAYAVRTFLAGGKPNLRRLAAAGQLIERQGGELLIISNFGNLTVSSRGDKRGTWTVTIPEDAPPAAVPPRAQEISSARRRAGRLGGLAKARRRHETPSDDANFASDLPEIERETVAKIVAKPAPHTADPHAGMGRNGHHPDPTHASAAVTAHAGAPASALAPIKSESPNLRIPEKKESIGSPISPGVSDSATRGASDPETPGRNEVFAKRSQEILAAAGDPGVWSASALERFRSTTGDEHSDEWIKKICRRALAAPGNRGVAAIEDALVEIADMAARGDQERPGATATEILCGHLAGVEVRISSPRRDELRDAAAASLAGADAARESAGKPTTEGGQT